MSVPRSEVVDRFGRPVPAEPVVALHVDRTPGRRPLHVDGEPVDVRRGADPHRAGLAAAAERARFLGRPVRVRMSSAWSEWPLVVHPDGSVDDARSGGPRASTLAGAWDRPRRRPFGVVAVASALAAVLLVGAVSTGVVTLGARGAPPAACRPATLFAVGGNGAGAAETLSAVTDPLVQRSGDKLTVVTVPPPEPGAGYAAAEQEAVTDLAGSVGEQLAACPTGAVLLFGYSEGAQVAGDLASRVGAGQEPGIAPGRVLAVGLFGDPARSADTRVVPEGASGQGVLPPRAAGFGALESRTIEICAPDDPVCATAPSTAAPTLEQALAAPTHASYPQLPVAAGTPATTWASDSLGRLVASLPAGGVGEDGQGGGAPSTTTPAPGGAAPGGTTTPPPGDAAPVTTTAPPVSTTAPPAYGTTTVPPGGDTGAAGEPGGEYGGGGYEDDGDAGGAAPPLTTTAVPGGGVVPTSPRERTSRTTAGEPSVVATTPRDRTRTTPGGDAGSTTTPRTAAPSGSTTTTTPREEDGSDTGADFAMSGGLEGWKSTPWNNQGASDPEPAPSPNVAGREAIRFDMPGGGQRNEAEPDIPNFTDGQTAFVGYSGFFTNGFPVDTDTWQLIMQFKQPGTGSPPLAVEVGHGQLRLANNGGNQRDFCPVRAGAPFDFRLRITFGGTVDAYCGDRQTLTDYATPTPNVDGSAYLKTGIYRDTAIGQDSSLFLDDLKVGDTLASVSGLAGGAQGDGTPTADQPTATTTTTPRSTPARATPTSAPAGTQNIGRRVCEKFGSTGIGGGRYLVQNNEWGADDGQCVTATAQGFSVDSGAHARPDGPAAYPSIMSGCWMQTCTEGTTLPAPIEGLGPITSSIAATTTPGGRYNLAYDIWADPTPRRDGQNTGMELMIWLRQNGGIAPIGSQQGTATIGGATWDVWKGENGGARVISYVRQGAVDAADALPITDFVQDAVRQGSAEPGWFLTNIQAGFEPWTGGPGLRVDRFSVEYG